MRLSQTCTESARVGAREETPYGNILVLAAAVYMVIARSDAEY